MVDFSVYIFYRKFSWMAFRTYFPSLFFQSKSFKEMDQSWFFSRTLFTTLWVSFIHGVYLRKTVLFLLMALSVTLIEYFAGLIFIKGMHVKLWDYSDEKFNIQGIICPKFTFFWYLLSAIYYFLIHPNIIHSIEWLAGNLWFSFFVGLFYGVFLIDVGYSLNILNNIQKFAKENDIIVQYEAFRKHIGELRNEFKEKERFVFSMKLDHISIKKSLKAYFDKYYK